jgi:endo-1,4-beta-xylanase
VTSPTPTPTASSSGPPTDPPSPTPSDVGSCSVSYRVTGSWQGGFQGEVKITNNGTAISGWRVGWTFTAGQTVAQLWGGSASQSGSTVTVTNASWNGNLATGGAASFGFLGSWTGSNPVPPAFTLNGNACTTT